MRPLVQTGVPGANAGKFTVSTACHSPVTANFQPLAGRFQRRNRRTEVLLIPNCLAMADLLRPAAASRCTAAAWCATVGGRPWGMPRFRAWAMPALTRSRRLSRSNSAKIASSPAMARPVGVAKSNASLREINPPPRVPEARAGSRRGQLRTDPSDPSARPRWHQCRGAAPPASGPHARVIASYISSHSNKVLPWSTTQELVM